MTETGRRETKRNLTRARIRTVARELFLRNGYEQTTIEHIAEAAGVSRRTFFHYYTAKEDVIFSDYDDFENTLADAICSAPSGCSTFDLAEHAVIATLEQLDPEDARTIEQLKQATPALRARDQSKFEWLERVVGDALYKRSVRSDPTKTRLEAVLIAGVLRVALEGWVAASDAGMPVTAHVKDVLAHLDA